MGRGYKGVAGLFDDAFDAGVKAAAAPTRGSQEKILPISPFSPSSRSAKGVDLTYAAPKRNTIDVRDVSPVAEPRRIRPGSMEDYDTPRYVGSDSMADYDSPKYIPSPPKGRTSFLGRVASGDVASKNFNLSKSRYTQRKTPASTVNSYDDSYLDAPGDFKTDYRKRRPSKDSKVSYLGRVASGTFSNLDFVRPKGKYSAKKAISGEAKPISPQEPVAAMDSPNSTHLPAMGFGSANAVVGGALVGGGTAWIGSTEENRGVWTFAKGATFGAAGGAVVSGVASRGMISGVAEWGQAVSKNFDFGTEFAGKAVQTARGIESAEARAALFATGAMLGGGMFGTNRNRAQGLNSTRGNRFGG